MSTEEQHDEVVTSAPEVPGAHSEAPPDEPTKPILEPTKASERPHRDAVVHKQCKIVSVLKPDVADAMQRTPGVVGTLRCPHCRVVRPVAEFEWQGGGTLP